MSNTLPLLNTTITLSEALREDDNILAQIEYPQKRTEFFNYLAECMAEIENIVSFHLDVKKCRASDPALWLTGSFNVCIPVFISPPSNLRSVLVRIPLPYKVVEARSRGSTEEKLRCEVASYLWMQEHCPNVPIPFLFGFGFLDGQTFTAPDVEKCRPCRYLSRRRQSTLESGYMIISRISDGEMLSNSWEKFHYNKTRRKNLFHDLSRIALQLNKTTLTRIGSLIFNNEGSITLTNRPLTLQLQLLENEGIPTNIDRDSTYSAVEPYLLDLLGCHDNRIRHQPNSIHNEDDGQQQLAALTVMLSTLHHFTERDFRHGPFVFTLTDLHQSNIFVDDKWHITAIIDLEWPASLPLQLQCPPYWLSGRGIDQMEHGERLTTFEERITEYLDAFEDEERAVVGDAVFQAPLMRRTWASGGFWYFQAVKSPKGLLNVFAEHIQRLYHPEHSNMRLFDEVVSPYWSIDTAKVINDKIQEEKRYKDKLEQVFVEAGGGESQIAVMADVPLFKRR